MSDSTDDPPSFQLAGSRMSQMKENIPATFSGLHALLNGKEDAEARPTVGPTVVENRVVLAQNTELFNPLEDRSNSLSDSRGSSNNDEGDVVPLAKPFEAMLAEAREFRQRAFDGIDGIVERGTGSLAQLVKELQTDRDLHSRECERLKKEMGEMTGVVNKVTHENMALKVENSSIRNKLSAIRTTLAAALRATIIEGFESEEEEEEEETIEVVQGGETGGSDELVPSMMTISPREVTTENQIETTYLLDQSDRTALGTSNGSREGAKTEPSDEKKCVLCGALYSDNLHFDTRHAACFLESVAADGIAQECYYFVTRATEGLLCPKGCGRGFAHRGTLVHHLNNKHSVIGYEWSSRPRDV